MSTNYLTSDSPTSQVPSASLNLEQATILIIERARQLVKRLVVQRGHEKPPFLAEEFAPLQRIKEIVKTDLGELDALLLRLQDGYIIKVNANHHPVRQNFSCAHEIGHTFLDELDLQASVDTTESRMPSSNIGGKAKERLCNIAATELLMPGAVFKKYLSRFGVTISSIEWLAHIFKVSIPATAVRVAELSEEPCIALRWDPWQKPKSKGFHLVWPDRILKSKYVRNPSPLLEAYESASPVKAFKFFEIGNIRKRCPMESKGFGHGKTRYVISLVFPR